MADLLLGAMAAATLFLLLQYSQRRRLGVVWWQWALTVLNLAYAVFVVKVTLSFLEEGMPKGAIVMGSILGFAAVVWAVLLLRFVFRAPRQAAAGGKEPEHA
jgi:hypothetical protein